MTMIKKKENVVRSNTRILPHQAEYIKKLAKNTGHTEGAIFREIVQFFIDSHLTDAQ